MRTGGRYLLVDHPLHQVADLLLRERIAAFDGFFARQLQNSGTALFHGVQPAFVFQLIQKLQNKVPGLRLSQHHGNGTHPHFAVPEGFHRQPHRLQQRPIFLQQRLLPPRKRENQRNQQFLSRGVLVIGFAEPVKQKPLVHRMLINQQQIVRIFHQDKRLKSNAQQFQGFFRFRRQCGNLFHHRFRHGAGR